MASRQFRPGAFFDGLLIAALRLLLAFCVFAIMAITTVDVVARYALSAPLHGAFEIVTLLLAVSVFLGLPLVTRTEDHIVVDILSSHLRGRIGWGQRLGVLLISTAVVAFITARLWHHAGLLAHAGHVTGFLEWPLAPLAYTLSGLCGVTVLVQLGMIWTHIRRLGRGGASMGEV